MKLGVYNAILHDRPLPEALKVIAGLGLTGIEINSGGFLPAVHIPTFDDILESDAARDDYLAIFEGTGVSIAGLNCNGNPLHPNRTIGDKHAEDIRRSIRLAHRLGQNRVVTMSGLPGGEPGATVPNWIVNAWNSAALDVLDYQWGIAADFWKETDRLARGPRRQGRPRTAPAEPRLQPADVYKLVELTGATHVGVELDASHLFWQQMDPVAVVRELGPLVFQAAAKDVRVNKETRRASTASWTTASAGCPPRRTAPTSAATSGPTNGPSPPPGTSSPSARATTPRTGPSSCAPCTRWTPTCSSTSNTKTSSWAASKASRSQPRF